MYFYFNPHYNLLHLFRVGISERALTVWIFYKYVFAFWLYLLNLGRKKDE